VKQNKCIRHSLDRQGENIHCPSSRVCLTCFNWTSTSHAGYPIAIIPKLSQLITILKYLRYVQRLKILNLTTLEERRKRGDLIELYKLLTQKENVDYQQFLQKEENQYRLQGHIVPIRCPFLASEQICGNRFSATEPWTVRTDYLSCRCRYCADMQIKIRHIRPRCGKLKLIRFSSHHPQSTSTSRHITFYEWSHF